MKRDAIHIPTLIVTAGEALGRAVYVKVVGGKAYNAQIGSAIGITNPFNRHPPVLGGQDVEIYIFPHTVMTISHNWELPALTEILIQQGEGPKKDYIHEAADICGYTREDFVKLLLKFARSGSYKMDNSEKYKKVSSWNKVWTQLYAETGEEFVLEMTDDTPFTCSC